MNSAQTLKGIYMDTDFVITGPLHKWLDKLEDHDIVSYSDHGVTSDEECTQQYVQAPSSSLHHQQRASCLVWVDSGTSDPPHHTNAATTHGFCHGRALQYVSV
jgi:hypothetical protein